jgi:hypothetical protein
VILNEPEQIRKMGAVHNSGVNPCFFLVPPPRNSGTVSAQPKPRFSHLEVGPGAELPET